MANNCLVTKLKSVVDNDSLLKLGEIRIGRGAYRSDDANYCGVNLSSWDETTQTSIDVNMEFVALGSDIKLPNMFDDGNMDRTYYKGGGLNFRIISASHAIGDNLVSEKAKYNITTVLVGMDIKFDMNNLSYCSLLKEIGSRLENANASYLSGNLATILKSCKSNIKTIRLLGSNVTGSTDDLKDCISLEELTCSATISGDWYQFVVGQRLAGRTTGHVGGRGRFPGNFNGHSTEVMWGETKTNNYIEWTADKAFIYNKTAQNVITVFTIGYTDQEIATKTAAGGDWEDANVTKCD